MPHARASQESRARLSASSDLFRDDMYFQWQLDSEQRRSSYPLNRIWKPGFRSWRMVGAYVLMPDHLHAFVAIDDQRLTLSMWMKSLKNALSRTLRVQGVPSPHWRKGFFDHILRSAESYGGKWSYVR